MVESWLVPDTPFFDLVTGIEAALNCALIFEIKKGGLMQLGTATDLLNYIIKCQIYVMYSYLLGNLLCMLKDNKILCIY